MPFEELYKHRDMLMPQPVFFIDQQSPTLSAHGFINVQERGARGDGLTDDTATIQSTIDAAPHGATIYFPTGTYCISQTLQLKNGQTYLGDGPGSNIKQADNANLIALLAVTEFMTNATYSSIPLRVSNLSFDGNRTHNTALHPNGGHGIIFMSSNSLIEACAFYNISRSAIIFSDRNLAGTIITNSSIENYILHCKVESTGQYGIWIRDQSDGRCTDGYIRDCVVSDTADTAIFVERGAGWFLSGNHVYGCMKSGIVVNNAWSTNIIGNEVDGYGYDLTPAPNYYSGISVTCIGPRATVVEGNIISTTEVNPHTIYQHLSLSGGATTDTRCLVLGNNVLGGYVSTSSSTSVPGPGLHTIVLNSLTNIAVGQSLTIALGTPNQETVTVSALKPALTANGNTLTAQFGRAHSGTYQVTSSTSPGNSIGILVQSFTTQIASGQLFSVLVALNQIDGVGKTFFQDAAPTTLISPESVIGNLQVAGDLLSFGHNLSTGPEAKALSGPQNGSNAPQPVIQGNDTRGVLNFGCGTGATPGVQVNVIFSSSYPARPVVVISPASSASAQTVQTWYVSSISKSGFSIASTNSPAKTAQADSTYCFTYQVIG